MVGEPMGKRKRDNSKYLGIVIMVSALVFGMFYAYSLYKWISVHKNDPEAWTWWVVVIPVALIVGFVVFFVAWIGWVIIKPRPKSIDEFIKEQEAKLARSTLSQSDSE